VNADVAVVGAGPAGLSAALNLVRARRNTVVLDSNRPRNAATFHSHGYLTRDGISPLELRAIGREEIAAYPNSTFLKTTVSSVTRVGEGFAIATKDDEHSVRAVVIATGLAERLPGLPSIRAWYGTSIHSCIECDAYEYADRPIALIGETDDLADRAVLLSQWSRDLIVFTNGIGTVSAQDEERLASRGILVERRAIADVVGNKSGLTGVALEDGETIPRSGAFVRPQFESALGFAASLGLEVDDEGLLIVDPAGRTSEPGVYAAGDSTQPGPLQLIVAAGAGAKVAAAVNTDLITIVDSVDPLTYR
jgi:thioredoxin reductase